MGPLEFASRIRNIQQIRHREGDAPSLDENANLVTLMTIHKSKGLEFPVVVLPDTHQRLHRKLKEIVCDPTKGLLCTKFTKEQSIFHEWLDAKRKQAEREEELRTLYVGMTRAKEKLCVCVHPSRHTDTLAGIVGKVFQLRNSSAEGIFVRKKPHGLDSSLFKNR
jgi:ATP-dependent exoDNAse (exonuclease V) beta subunit